MKRLIVSSNVVMLIKSGAVSVTVEDYQQEEFPVGTNVSIFDPTTGKDFATALVVSNTTRIQGCNSVCEMDEIADSEETIKLSNIKLL